MTGDEGSSSRIAYVVHFLTGNVVPDSACVSFRTFAAELGANGTREPVESTGPRSMNTVSEVLSLAAYVYAPVRTEAHELDAFYTASLQADPRTAAAFVPVVPFIG